MNNKISTKISYNAQAKCQKLESFFGAVSEAVSLGDVAEIKE